MRSPFPAIVLFLIVLSQSSFAAVSDGEIKLALFSTYNGKECFLSTSELARFAAVVGRMTPEMPVVHGKFLPQEYKFDFWRYDVKMRELKRQSVSFNANGSSINWKMVEGDTLQVKSLTKDLLKRLR